MTDEEKNLQDAANQPYQPPEAAPSEPKPVESAWQPETYTPPSAEPPAEMTSTAPDEALFAPPAMDASSFEGAEPVQPPEPAVPPATPAMQGEVFTPYEQPKTEFTPPPVQSSGGSFNPPPVSSGAGIPPKKSTNWWLIVIIVVVVLCCCCAVVGILVYMFGDQILQQFQGYSSLILSLAV